MMWTFIFLSILPLNIYQAAAEENSTQMYYFKLRIDESAIANITKLLKPFLDDTDKHVTDLKMTTKCKNDSAGVTCSCQPNHRWSDDVCQSNEGCCGGSECTFLRSETQMCVSDRRVAVSGFVILKGPDYSDCLTDKTSKEHVECNNKLSRQMKTVFSTLRGFDTLKITGYRIGSVIADFEMIIANRIHPQDLIKKTRRLSEILPASLNLETAGIVHLSMPSNPVHYNASADLTCTSQEDLGTDPKWSLKKLDRVFAITTGTVSNVTTSRRTRSTVQLTGVNELWAGNYICAYQQQQTGITILHKANAIVDVCLLPDIHVSTQPPFPRCKSRNSVLKVTTVCEISKSSEPYNVSWKGEGISQTSEEEREETKVFTADKIVSCNPPNGIDPVNLLCTFENRCNQTRSATVTIYFINVDDKFCAAEGDWQDTKAGFRAELKCKSAAGLRRRYCSEDGEWEDEDSKCVNLDLDDVLQEAKIVDSGRGFLDENAADVFYRFEAATNDTDRINSSANINASVYILSTLNEKLDTINIESATDDLLESSSNLLEKSLSTSWSSATPEINLTLAEKYLSSVEQLIEIANITDFSRKANIEVATCSDEEKCENSVFNVNVTLKNSGNGSVKTAGFKQLESYLPYNNNESKPNSIVVSTTTNGSKDDVEITIDFPLFTPRPRHVKIQCVWWDNGTGQWSSEGCEWAGAANEGRCTCKHLSSFAILMSKHPENIKGQTEITYVGLSISVTSLVISLLIELVVWGDVVKTNTSHLRHIAHVNISLCLLVADFCFLASAKPHDISKVWCKTLTVLKHFCYLSMFFWMLCLSTTLLHQMLYVFHQVSRTHYLRLSLIVGYVCPLLIVFITFLTNNSGDESSYYSRDTCWLVYIGLMKGSIFTFIIPVGVIVFINIFSMVVVIMKLLHRQDNMVKSHEKEKAAVKTVLRSVVILTPVLGVTWIFGLGVLILDLTHGPIAFIVNYAFILLNAFQGLFILLTTCLGDKMTREALLKRLKKKAPVSASNSVMKLDSTSKK